jgi:glyoxylase-like metal-dependent hydrolase (beta-lactamase superfamily II)
MKQITDHLYQLESVFMCNVYLVDAGGGYYLVDSGLYGYAKAVMEELEEAGYPLSNLEGILHTHGHGDHIGNTAAWWKEAGPGFTATRLTCPSSRNPLNLQQNPPCSASCWG